MILIFTLRALCVVWRRGQGISTWRCLLLSCGLFESQSPASQLFLDSPSPGLFWSPAKKSQHLLKSNMIICPWCVSWAICYAHDLWMIVKKASQSYLTTQCVTFKSKSCRMFSDISCLNSTIHEYYIHTI